LNNNNLLFSQGKSRILLSVAFIILAASTVALVVFAYAGASHQAVLPGGIGRSLGLTGGHDKIAVVYVEGQMVSDKTSDGSGSAYSSDIVKAMRKATDDPEVKAIVMRVNSPGGTPVSAEEIISQMKKTRAIKPVVVSMGDMATSAAYYISSQTDRIVADPDTFTGSIGVIWVFENKSKSYAEDGISFYVAKTGDYKDLGSDKRGLTTSEKDYVQSVINESYDRFVSNVAKGRNLSEDYVRSIADGRVYTGSKAQQMGLIDDLGGLYDAISIAENMSKASHNAAIVYMNEPGGK